MNYHRSLRKPRGFTAVLVLLCAFLTITHSYGKGGNRMVVTSTAFNEGGMIPKQYTCDGEDISPPLTWSNVPDETKSLALICDDPDAPMGN